MHAWLRGWGSGTDSMTLAWSTATCSPFFEPQVGTFTLFQETYHRPTFKQMHISGPKSDYDHRLLSQVGLVVRRRARRARGEVDGRGEIGSGA